MRFYWPDLILYDVASDQYIRLSEYYQEDDSWSFSVWRKGAWGLALNHKWVASLQESTRRVRRLEALVVLGIKI